jgi:hypothetical protein
MFNSAAAAWLVAAARYAIKVLPLSLFIWAGAGGKTGRLPQADAGDITGYWSVNSTTGRRHHE